MALSSSAANAIRGEQMSYALRPGQTVKIGPVSFLILQKLSCGSWRVRNNESGEWCTFAEEDLLDRFTRNELTFDRCADDLYASTALRAPANLDRALASYPDKLVALAQRRSQYLKEIDRRQPISITPKYMAPLIQHVCETIGDTKPPGWRTLSREVLQTIGANKTRMSDREVFLLFQAEESAEDPSLPAPVMPGNPEHLAFSDHLRSFNAVDYIACRGECPRALHGSPAALHVSMI
jgi:hypothetical protein